MNRLKILIYQWIFPEEQEKSVGCIEITSPKFELTADFSDERSMRLARKVIDDVIKSRYNDVDTYVGLTD